MGWELEARLAKQGVDWRSIDDLMRLSIKNGDQKSVDKLNTIKSMESANVAGAKKVVASSRKAAAVV